MTDDIKDLNNVEQTYLTLNNNHNQLMNLKNTYRDWAKERGYEVNFSDTTDLGRFYYKGRYRY